MVCEGPEWARLRRGVSSMSEPASTVPASVRDIHVAHRALEGGGVPEVVDIWTARVKAGCQAADSRL